MRAITKIENICANLARTEDAVGVLLLIIHRDETAEVGAALGDMDGDGRRELADTVRLLAMQIEQGAGVATGRHGQTEPR